MALYTKTIIKDPSSKRGEGEGRARQGKGGGHALLHGQERRGEERGTSEPHPPQKQNQTKGIAAAAAALQRLATIYHRRSAQGRPMLNEFLVHKSGRTRWESTWQPCNRQPNGDANPTHHPPAHVSSAAQLHLLPDYGVLSCLCLCGRVRVLSHVRVRASFFGL